MSFQILGYTIGKNKTSQYSPNSERKRGKVSQAIKKQYRRELAFQIADIKQAELLATSPDAPSRRRLLEIYRYILKDLRLRGQLRDAVMKVTGEPWMIYDENENPQEEMSAKLRKRWMSQVIEMIAYVEFWGYSVPEFDEINAKDWHIGVVKLLPREHISIERGWVLIDAELNGSYIDYNGISNELDIVEFYRTREDLGMLNEIAYNTIWKFYARSDWSRTSEKFGMPMLSIQADTNNDDELDRLEDRAANFGTDGYIVTQKDDVANIIERKGQRIHDIFLDNIKLCNEENEIGINGQVGTSSEKNFVGAAEVQERKFEDITLTRLDFVQNEINDKLLPYLRYKGFAIPEGYTFNYPAIINERKKKLTRTEFQKPVPESPSPPGEGRDEDNKQADSDQKKETE